MDGNFDMSAKTGDTGDHLPGGTVNNQTRWRPTQVDIDFHRSEETEDTGGYLSG